MPQLYKTKNGLMFHAGLIALVPVGLPARGKTFMSQKLARYLRWMGVRTEVFNVGAHRRAKMGANIPHEFFDRKNKEAFEKRLGMAEEILDTMIKYLTEGFGQVGIYDSTLTIMGSRREYLVERFSAAGIETIFIESIVNDPSIIEANVRAVKLRMPDYVGWDPDKAVADFMRRIEHYTEDYDELNDPDQAYIRIFNLGLADAKIFSNKIKGFLPTRIVYYLMNLHIRPRNIYFVKNAEVEPDSKLKDDPPLSTYGTAFARSLAAYLHNLRRINAGSSDATPSGSISDGNDFKAALIQHDARAIGAPMKYLKVYCSTRKRSIDTSQFLDRRSCHIVPSRELTELKPGITEGLTKEQLKKQMPEDYERYEKDPYHYRFQRAESYHDLALRLEPFIMDIERERSDVLIVTHESVLRCLYVYYFNLEEDEIPRVAIPDHTLIQITPQPYGAKEQRYKIPVPMFGTPPASSSSSASVSLTSSVSQSPAKAIEALPKLG